MTWERGAVDVEFDNGCKCSVLGKEEDWDKVESIMLSDRLTHQRQIFLDSGDKCYVEGVQNCDFVGNSIFKVAALFDDHEHTNIIVKSLLIFEALNDLWST